jgi:hypothetical protein
MGRAQRPRAGRCAAGAQLQRLLVSGVPEAQHRRWRERAGGQRRN